MDMELSMDARSVLMRTLAARIEAGAEKKARKHAEVLSQLLETYTASKSFAVKGILREAVGKVERALAQEYTAAEAETLADRLAEMGASDAWQADAGPTTMRAVVDGGSA
ncbi:hypothetical protein [Delftia acidovorans]|jgi:hypothetical protein|uniref:hypothetical protein n=1 Tax=Delftia acidovorans TaxID=80866 RepID=UPI00034E03B1|nr:hypothetical protein [Delftia acidovorans]EPD35454.1 hypothetical protein HMPREF9702_05943 [Delftia acidovorans CCUG 15835]